MLRIFPPAGQVAFNGNLAVIEPDKYDPAISAEQYGRLAADRRPLITASRRDVPVDESGSEVFIERFTRLFGVADGSIAALTPMGPAEVADLIYNLVEDNGELKKERARVNERQFKYI